MSTPDNPQGTDPTTPSVPPAPGAPQGSPAYGQPPAYAQPPSYGQAPYGQAPTYGQQQPAPDPYSGQAPYGARAPYAPGPYGAYAAPKTNVLAIVSLIASLVGIIFILPFVGSLVGVITGHMSLSQIKRTGEQGRGLALAGTIVGYVGLGIILLVTIFFLSFLPLIIGSASSGTLS